ncbi:MAG: SapC family protein [Terricaulis sp.]
MAHHAALTFADHAKLRVIREHGAAFGDAVMSCPLFPAEFRSAQAHYPILFAKTGAGGRIAAIALFGLAQGENLFLSDETWDASYVPLIMRAAPFLIGFAREEDARAGGPAQVHIDLDHARVSRTAGEPLFLEGGASAPVLQEAADILGQVHQGAADMAKLADALEALDLLEPLLLTVTLNDGSDNRLVGFQAINEQKLNALEADDLHRLQSEGLLTPIFMAVAALGKIEWLATRKNQRLAPR